MRLAFLRSESANAVFSGTANEDMEDVAERLRISSKAGSSSKNIIVELLQRELIDYAAEWKFWDRPNAHIDVPGILPVDVFESHDGDVRGLEAEIEANGAPDILWCEGPHHPDYMRRAFELCPTSYKLVYSKDWKPWKVANLEAYNLCLVDEVAQAQRVEKTYPGVHGGVWDKLIDYEDAHRPLNLPKQYDLCYVAYFRARKNHALLLDALGKLMPRRVSCVLIGGDRDDTRQELEAQAARLGIGVTFLGEVSKAEVNHYVNSSRIGVMAAEKDAAPRAILEYLAADIPVLVNADLRAGSRYVDDRCGAVLPPERLHEGIARILDNYDSFTPRAAYLERFSKDRVIERFLSLLEDAGLSLTSGASRR